MVDYTKDVAKGQNVSPSSYGLDKTATSASTVKPTTPNFLELQQAAFNEHQMNLKKVNNPQDNTRTIDALLDQLKCLIDQKNDVKMVDI